MHARAVFLDVDGVLLDEERTPLEWIRLLGDVLAPALGGEPEEWGRANGTAFPVIFADRRRWYDADPIVAERRLVTLMLRAQCEIVGVAYPGDDDAVALGREMDEYVCRRSRSEFPSTVSVIRELASERPVHTATGNPSWRVRALLEQWGVRDLVGFLAGPDLVGVMKDTEAFYRGVLELSGVTPDRAIVVDDASAHLARAHAVGMRTVLMDPAGTQARGPHIGAVIRDIAELPEAARRLD